MFFKWHLCFLDFKSCRKFYFQADMTNFAFFGRKPIFLFRKNAGARMFLHWKWWRQNKRDLFFCNKEIEFIRLQKGIKIVKKFGRETNYSSIVIWTSSSRQIARIELNPAVLMQIDVAGFIRQRLVNHCSTDMVHNYGVRWKIYWWTRESGVF